MTHVHIKQEIIKISVREWKDKGIFLGFNRQENISTSELVDRVKNQHQIQSHH